MCCRLRKGWEREQATGVHAGTGGAGRLGQGMLSRLWALDLTSGYGEEMQGHWAILLRFQEGTGKSF